MIHLPSQAKEKATGGQGKNISESGEGRTQRDDFVHCGPFWGGGGTLHHAEGKLRKKEENNRKLVSSSWAEHQQEKGKKKAK